MKTLQNILINEIMDELNQLTEQVNQFTLKLDNKSNDYRVWVINLYLNDEDEYPCDFIGEQYLDLTDTPWSVALKLFHKYEIYAGMNQI